MAHDFADLRDAKHYLLRANTALDRGNSERALDRLKMVYRLLGACEARSYTSASFYEAWLETLKCADAAMDRILQ